MQGIEVLLLDADNTLFDFNAAERAALEQALRARDLPFSEQILEQYIELNESLWRGLEQGMVKSKDIPTMRFTLFFDARGWQADAEDFGQFYLQCLGAQSILLPGAEDFVQKAAKKYRLAIITNGITPVQRGRLDRSPIKPYIEQLIISEQVGYSKPARELFDHALRLMHINSSQAVMIGDSLPADIVGGHHAGIRTVWFNPQHDSMDGAVPPDYTVDGFAALAELFQV